MKLLIVTQAVDSGDPVLGFFHRWLIEFAQHVESLTVICLYEGEHDLPENVQVYSLGKEHGARSSVSYGWAFLKLVWRLRDSYDTVFVHMNPEYLVLAGPLWRMLGKRSVLWYMHKAVTWRLYLGVWWANAVCTASPQSMRIATRKKHVVGHGIIPFPQVPPPSYPPLALLTIGRLSRIKRVHVVIDTLDMLVRSGIDARLTIVGGAVTDDGRKYETELRDQVEGLGLVGRVVFAGPQPQAALEEYFAAAHLFLHASDTGSLDKASLEPLSAGVPVITTDSELAAVGIRAVMYAEPEPESFTGAVRKALGARLWEHEEVRNEASRYIREHHELTSLVPKILVILGA
ncbi:MAG: glycosyltransferase [Bacillota bacterium]